MFKLPHKTGVRILLKTILLARKSLDLHVLYSILEVQPLLIGHLLLVSYSKLVMKQHSGLLSSMRLSIRMILKRELCFSLLLVEVYLEIKLAGLLMQLKRLFSK